MSLDSGSGRFPTTRMSAVAGLASDDATLRARAFAAVSLGYYKPVYKHVRIKWRRSAEEAKDITQEFFATALEKDYLGRYDPGRAHFRSFVRMCLDRFVAKRRRAAARMKRGGQAALRSIDFDEAEAEIARFGPPAGDAVDDYFDREWARHVFGVAYESVRAACAARGHEVRFRVFERYEVAGQSGERPSYADVARELGIAVTDVTNHLSYTRRELRRAVLRTLRELTASDEELQSEARALLGVKVDVSSLEDALGRSGPKP